MGVICVCVCVCAGCECGGSGSGVPGQDVRHAQADRSSGGGGGLVSLPPWVRVLALGCGHQHTAEL